MARRTRFSLYWPTEHRAKVEALAREVQKELIATNHKVPSTNQVMNALIVLCIQSGIGQVSKMSIHELTATLKL